MNENYSLDEIVISAMAREYKGEIIVGGPTYCTLISALLAKRVHNPDLILLSSMNYFDGPVIPNFTMTEFYSYELGKREGGSGFSFSMSELFEFIMEGRFAIFVNPVQIDQFGNANISVIGDWAKPAVQLVGARGLPDDSVNVDNMFYYNLKHSVRTFTPKVDFICGVGYTKERLKGEITYGAPKAIVSNLGVFDFEQETGHMRIRSLHPGVTLQTVRENTGFELVIPEVIPETPLPTEEEVRLIRQELDPLGTRRLEFVDGKEAAGLMAEIIRREKELIR